MLHDRGAFSGLVRIHQGKIRAYLLRLVRDYDRANDLAQETFLKAFRKIDQYKSTGSFGGWLFSIAHTTFLESQRSAVRRQDVHQEWEHEFELQADHYDHATDDQLDLERALSQIKPEQAAAISLCYSYGFSHSEAAKILQLPEGTVKTNIARGRKKLAELLRLEEEPAHEIKRIS